MTRAKPDDRRRCAYMFTSKRRCSNTALLGAHFCDTHEPRVVDTTTDYKLARRLVPGDEVNLAGRRGDVDNVQDCVEHGQPMVQAVVQLDGQQLPTILLLDPDQHVDLWAS